MSNVFTLGHSPDPDDAFMFYAMAERKIDLRGYEFEHILQDIQTLNERATRGELHISAISIHAYAYVSDKYAILPCGASMGDNYGPMIVCRPGAGVPASDAPAEVIREWLPTQRLVIPGRLTTAALALRLFMGTEVKADVVPFDEIFAAIADGRADAGLIIHEGQLTFDREGLVCALDLGKWWYKETGGLPLPLGGNVIRRDIPSDVRSELNAILKESIAYGLAHRGAGVAHAMPLARDMTTDLADKFIGMYVNDYTLDYGDKGRRAIEELLGRAHRAGAIPSAVDLEFVA
jgi:1,4-dihydroxy-6-naphthoate synthase